MIIKHQYLTKHNYTTVALPCTMKPEGKMHQLQQKDGSLIDVEYVDFWQFPLTDLPNVFCMVCFGITAQQLALLLRRQYPALAALPEAEQIVYIFAMKKI